MPNQDSHGDPQIELYAALGLVVIVGAAVALFVYLMF